MLQAGRERKPEGFPGLVARLGSWTAIRDPFKHCVWVRVEPHLLGQPCGPGWLGHRRYLLRAAPPVAERVQATIGRDPVQPGAERGSLLEAAQAPPGREQRLLHDVLGILQGPKKSVAVQMKLSSVGLDQLPKCGLVARSGTAELTLAHVDITDQRFATNSHHSY